MKKEAVVYVRVEGLPESKIPAPVSAGAELESGAQYSTRERDENTKRGRGVRYFLKNIQGWMDEFDKKFLPIQEVIDRDTDVEATFIFANGPR
jgi:hypothetical protein